MNRVFCPTRSSRRKFPAARRGSVLVLAAALFVMVFAFAAFSLDLGYITVTKNELQTAADAAAYAGANVLGNGNAAGQALARTAALELAELNAPGWGEVLKDSDITFGDWDADTKTFTPDIGDPNAIKVVLRRAGASGNALQLFFAPVIGHDTADISVTAIAMAQTQSGGPQFRFLLDDEMFDSDVQEIEDLADELGTTPENLISDLDDDGFIDIPGGRELELPTGQTGDEAMFDRSTFEDAFPFTPESDYTLLDFLAEGTALQDQLGTQPLQDVQWTAANAPHPDLNGKKLLDPVTGVDPLSTHSEIMQLPDPDVILLSPLFKSDVSMAETDPSKYGSPAANLQGERRGLVAFKIKSARSNPAGGSYLPLLTIEIVDPSTINFDDVTLEAGSAGESSSARLVQ